MHRPIAEYRLERGVLWVRYRYRTGRKYLRLGSDDILRERGRGEYRLHDRAGSVEPGDRAVQKRCAFVDRSRRYYPTIACGERRIVVFRETRQREKFSRSYIHDDARAAAESLPLRVRGKYRIQLALHLCIYRKRYIFSILRQKHDVVLANYSERISFYDAASVHSSQSIIER